MPGHSGGLTKWFKEGWVDISRPRKGGGYAPCGRKSARGKGKGGYPKCVPASKFSKLRFSEFPRPLQQHPEKRVVNILSPTRAL